MEIATSQVRRKTGPKTAKRQNAAALIRTLLADGEWHRSEDIAPAVEKLVPCHRKTVELALLEIGEYRLRRKPDGKQEVPRRSDWRLVEAEADHGARS